MNQDQVLSIVRSLLKVAGAALVSHGLAKVGAVVNAEDTVGLVMTLIGFYLSHKEHSPEVTEGATPKSSGPGVTVPIMLLLASLTFVGCAGLSAKKLEAGGAYAPLPTTNSLGVVTTNAPDLSFYIADATFEQAYSAFSAIFKLERDNRAFFYKISPEIKHSLDKIRPTAWEVTVRYLAARDVYLANPTPAGLTTVQEFLARALVIAEAANAGLTPQQAALVKH